MSATQSRVNDFVLKIGTVNGTGSASANGLLMKALFRMGIPVTGKNMFPSNIQGLPTWYEIRASKDGYNARSGRRGRDGGDECANLQTRPGGSQFRRIPDLRFNLAPGNTPSIGDDITVLGVPLAKLANENFSVARVRILMKNVAYVGVLAALLDIDLDIIRELLKETFASKPKLVDSNLQAIMLGYDYANEHFTCPLPVRTEKMDGNQGKVLMEGNAAAALGAVYAGATVGAWYPITPSTSVMDGFKQYCDKFRTDPDTGERRFCIIQAEDELAAAGIVLGANWAGARAFTPTSGPGISLMSEFIGLPTTPRFPRVH